MDKKAIIIGAKGQDGTLLGGFLLNKGYHVIGVGVDFIHSSEQRVLNKVDILKENEVNDMISSIKPDEIYYLAAYHHSSQDKEVETRDLIDKSYKINIQGLVNFLEAIRRHSVKTRLFYASSSLIFGNTAQNPQTEETPLNPVCIYGISKVAGMQICRFYAQKHAVFASIGILYNHESHLRPENYLSQKIVTAAKKIKAGLQKELVVGDLGAQADWGYAWDYVEAMWKILQSESPDTFIVATGKTHFVSDWVRLAFAKVGLNSKDYVHEDKSFITRKKGILVGDSSKLCDRTGWKPKTSFEEMISLMMQN